MRYRKTELTCMPFNHIRVWLFNFYCINLKFLNNNNNNKNRNLISCWLFVLKINISKNSLIIILYLLEIIQGNIFIRLY